MNRNILTLFFLLMCIHVFAQNIECKYTSTTVIPEDVKNIEDANIRNIVINQLSNKKKTFSLKVSNGKYLFEAISNEQNNGTVMQIGGSSSIYMDMNTKTSISQENILDRTFLIKETLKTYDWNITTENKEIINKKCTKATLKENPTIVAWFTSEIPVSFGPMGYYGLPGLILQLETPSKNYIIQEISVSKENISIKAPDKGKEISREDFDALKKKKQESFGINKGNGSKVKIIKM